MTTYRIEFGPAWPVPPITVDFTDRSAAARQVAEHAIPYLRPVLAEKGRPELADCFFHTDRALTGGQFMWLDLAGEKAARFCPARLTPTDLDPDICGDQNDDEVCDLDPGHDGDHCANVAVGWANRFARPAAGTPVTKSGVSA
ncbi:hypothetical protein [Streptomyces pseudogriseolus]|uniref:hypothetical protein n=1 Tax=Streptomyces pseudogriseolus TaxID=36817 RepID=UPI0034845738